MNYNKIGEKIRVWRAKKHTTQRELSRQLKISVRTISEIENGKKISMFTIYRIQEHIKVKLL